MKIGQGFGGDFYVLFFFYVKGSCSFLFIIFLMEKWKKETKKLIIK